MPDFWQWFFNILGAVAFLMAMPFVLQLLFGQPHIGYAFFNSDEKTGRVIKLNLMNPPVNNRLLQYLRVARMTAQDVYLMVKVYSVPDGKIIGDQFLPEIAMSNTNKDGRVSLPPSILLSSAILVKWDRVSNSAQLLCGTELIPLAQGKYVFDVKMGLDGLTKQFKQLGRLHVGNTETELTWDKAIMNHFFRE